MLGASAKLYDATFVVDHSWSSWHYFLQTTSSFLNLPASAEKGFYSAALDEISTTIGLLMNIVEEVDALQEMSQDAKRWAEFQAKLAAACEKEIRFILNSRLRDPRGNELFDTGDAQHIEWLK